MSLKTLVRTVPHYPRQGVMFRDITTLIKDPAGFQRAIDDFVERYRSRSIDKVVAIESRGFIFGAPLAIALGTGFVPMRKAGKLPDETVGADYELEYGADRIEIHIDAIAEGDRVLLVDDLIATGGTSSTAANLLTEMGAHVDECAFVIELLGLGGRERLAAAGYDMHALCAFTDDETDTYWTN